MVLRILIQSSILIHLIIHVNAHGFLSDPVGRASAWRKNFQTPSDFDDDGLFCGGFNSHWEMNNGRCGICGDAYEGPRPHEVGGKFVTKPPTIVETYEQGDLVDVTVNLTANHGGFFVFQLCPVDDPDKEATEDCLNENNLEVIKDNTEIYKEIQNPHPIFAIKNSMEIPMKSIENLAKNELDNEIDLNGSNDDSYELDEEIDNRINGLESRLVRTIKKRDNLFNPVDLNDHTYDKFKFFVPYEEPKSYTIKVKLPNEMNCRRCVFRWIYVTGNTWGICGNTNEGKSGCGVQEEFRNCADIKIH